MTQGAAPLGKEKLKSVVPKSTVRVKFGTAGIRGIFGQEVSIREAMAVCFAVHELVGQGRFGLGYDSRMSSRVLALASCAAMNYYGSDVENYGMIPTPVLAFNIKESRLHAGFSVTASHNPPEFAGVKVFGTEGIEFSLEAEQQIEELIRKSVSYTKRETELVDFGRTFENEEAIHCYREAVVSRAQGTKRPFRILVDCANGTSGEVTPRILSELGHKVVTVNAHPSGAFPGRLPEPMVETLGEVSNLTRALKADFAITHDGDADRLVMIDGRGVVVPDYALSSLVLRIILDKVRRGTVIMSLNSSSALESLALQAGCKVQRSRLGKTFEELYKRKGIYASEPSKMVDPRWGYWEDGIYTAVIVTQYLSSLGINLEEALGSIPRCYNLQKNLSVSSPLDYEIVRKEVGKRFPGRVEGIDDLDGVKVRLKANDSWFMLRSSGTEKKARVYVESSDEKEARSLLEEVVAIAYSAQSKVVAS